MEGFPKKETGYKWIVSILLILISVLSSFSSLLAPYAKQVWLIVLICGLLPFVLVWKSGHPVNKILKQIPITTALVALIAAAITQVIAANDLPSGLAPLHALPGLKLIYGSIGGAVAFVLTWLSLTNEKWASGGAALAAAGLYSSVIFFRVSAVQEVGAVYVVMIGFCLIFGLSQKNGISYLYQNETGYWRWAAFFAAVLVLAALVSPVPGQSFSYVLNMLILIGLAGCVAWFVRTISELKTAAWMILIFGAGLPVVLALIKTLDIATVFNGLMVFSYRLHPTEMGGANLIARSLLITAPLGGALFFINQSQGRLSKTLKWGIVLLEVLILAVILYSRSFEGFFAWLVGFGVFLIFSLWNHIQALWVKITSRPVVRVFTIVTIILVAAGLLFASIRIAATVNIYSFNGRFAHWTGAIAAIRNHPLLGGGPDNEYIYTKFSENVTLVSGSQDILDDPLYVIRFRSGLLKLHGHNIFLETAAFTGLAGLLGLLGMLYALIRIGLNTWLRGNQHQRLLVAACLAGIAGESSWGLLDVTRETPPFFSFPVWAIVGLLLALSRFPSDEHTELVKVEPIFETIKLSRVIMGVAVFVALLSSLASNQYASGFLAFQEHRWRDAAKNFQMAVYLDPLSAHYRWMLSKVDLETGQIEQARQNLDQAIALKQGYSPYLAQAGWLAWYQDDLKAANQHFEEAIVSDSLEGWTTGLYANLGLLKAYQGQEQEAIQLFAKSIEYHPELAAAPYWIKKQLPDGSVEPTLDPAYEQSGHKSELKIRLLSQLGRSDITSNNFDLLTNVADSISLSAVLDVLHGKYSTETTQMNPDAHLILAAEAEAARVSGLYDRAEGCYQEYQELQPDSSFGYRDLGLVYTDRNQLEQAQTLLNQASQISPNDLETLKLLGNLYLQQQDLSGVENILEFTTPIAANDSFHLRLFDVEILELWRNLYFASGDIAKVNQTSKWIAAIRGAPEDYLASGHAEGNSPDEKTAECWRAYEKLVKTWARPYDSRFWEVATCVASSTESNQQIDKHLVKIDQNYYRSLLLGHIFRLRNQFDLAEKSYTDVVRFRSDDGAAHYFLGELFVVMNDFPNAEKEFSLAGDLESFESLPLIALGDLYRTNNNISGAIASYQKAIIRSPGWEAGHFAIANLYYKLGEHGKAAKHYELAIKASQMTLANEVYNFISNMTKAVYSPNIAEDYIKGDIFEINGEQKSVIFMHPESWANYTLHIPEIEKGDEVRLNFWFGISPDSWNQVGDGVNFTVSLLSSGLSQEIFSGYLDPKHNFTDRRWQFASIDLTSVAGKEITIIFKTDAGPAGDNRFDWAGWGDPRIVVVPQEP